MAWRKEITPHNFDVTIGSSPVLFDDTVLMLCAMTNKKDSKLVAYDKADGSIRWEAALAASGIRSQHTGKDRSGRQASTGDCGLRRRRIGSRDSGSRSSQRRGVVVVSWWRRSVLGGVRSGNRLLR